MDARQSEITRVLQSMGPGGQAGVEQLVPLIYDDLRRIAQSELSNERAGHTLQATALVHEAYMRLARLTDIEWKSRAHFYGAAAQTIRRILVDHARSRKAAKRGGNAARVEFDVAHVLPHCAGLDLLDVHEAIEDLASLSARQARIVELRVFGGMSSKEVALVLDMKVRTVQGDWSMARQWLRARLEGGTDE